MNTTFYLAVDRLPLSTVGAIEFLGTVILAAAGARTPRNAAGPHPHHGGRGRHHRGPHHRRSRSGSSSPSRTARCSCCTSCSATGSRTRAAPAAIDRLGAAMLVAAVVATPWGLGGALPAFGHPVLLLAGAGVGVCSSVIPYVTDQLAMARLPRATFALMLALLPVFATVIGAIVLRQLPTVQDVGGDHPGSTRRRRSSGKHQERNEPMEYVRLGSAGLQVSRICLGMMSYGDPGRGGAWHLDEAAAGRSSRRPSTSASTSSTPPNVYSDGASEEITGRALRELFARRDDVVLATKVLRPDAARARTAGACPARRSWPRSTPACAGSAPTTSTSTRSTAGTRDADRGDDGGAARRRARRARPATSARRRCTPGSSPRPSTWPSATAGPGSSPCRTTTTCSTARRSGRCSRSAPTRASA